MLLISSCGDPMGVCSAVVQTAALMGKIPNRIVWRDFCRVPVNHRHSGSLEPTRLLSTLSPHLVPSSIQFFFMLVSLLPVMLPCPLSLHSSRATLHHPFALFICSLMCWENKDICICVTEGKTYDRAGTAPASTPYISSLTCTYFAFAVSL